MAENISHEMQDSECTFQWDDTSQLYYHASSGFYHDPQAGWYYSTIDGLYYKFENGNYVLIESYQEGDKTEMSNTNSEGEISKSRIQGEEVSVESSQDYLACNSSEQSEYPPPPSEWLEETLIDMYLAGYSNRSTNAVPSDIAMPIEIDDDAEELEEGEWIPDDPDFWSNLSENFSDEGISQEEKNWRAQYGQVHQLDEDWMSDLEVVDLWDWSLVRGTKKDGKTEVAKLVGRLRKRSSSFHPSVPSGGGKLKTAPVCEVQLDVVRVTSGKIYRLRIPSLQYLASLSAYDASNPTKDWDFPRLSFDNNQTKKLPKHNSQSETPNLDGLDVQIDKSLSSKKGQIYRDRAAERRALHRGFGVGPGQKNYHASADSDPPSPTTSHPEAAAAESLNISFGEGSYARKILESMGWKEGETLGCSMKGLTEPLRATGNKGNAGLGYADSRRRNW